MHCVRLANALLVHRHYLSRRMCVGNNYGCKSGKAVGQAGGCGDAFTLVRQKGPVLVLVLVLALLIMLVHVLVL